MKHNYISDDISGDHWAVGNNGENKILIQLQQNGEQVRIGIDINTAYSFANQILSNINKLHVLQTIQPSQEFPSF